MQQLSYRLNPATREQTLLRDVKKSLNLLPRELLLGKDTDFKIKLKESIKNARDC